MIELSATAFLWIKALHIIAVIAWMAGMLYLPRLFVYHCGAETGSGQSETFKIMERRLLRVIINPAMVAALVFGGILLADLGAEQWRDGWLHAKLALVVALFVMHHLMARWRKAFERDENTRPAKFYRRMNEVPAVLMAAIVILAVVKPF